jgi:hypothetical protein
MAQNYTCRNVFKIIQRFLWRFRKKESAKKKKNAPSKEIHPFRNYQTMTKNDRKGMNHHHTALDTSNRQVETSSSSVNCLSLHQNKSRCRIKSSYFPHEDDEATSEVVNVGNAKGNLSSDDDEDDDEQTKFLTFPTFKSVLNDCSSNKNDADKKVHPITLTTTPRPLLDTSLSTIPKSINKTNGFDSSSPPLPTALHELLGLSQAIHTMSQKSSPITSAKEANNILYAPDCYPPTIDKSNNSTTSCPIMEDSTITTTPYYDKATFIDTDLKDRRRHVCSGKYNDYFISIPYIQQIITSQANLFIP